MISVGIDVSKEKSTVCILKPYGEIVAQPYEVRHTDQELGELATMLHRLNDEVKVVMEATGIYYLPVVTYLQEHHLFVSVINPYLMRQYRRQNLRKGKTDKLDSIAISNYGIEHWFSMQEYRASDETYESLKILSRQYRHFMRMHVEGLLGLTHLLDYTMPGIKKQFSSWDYTSGKDKLSDFVDEFWHYRIITDQPKEQFIEKYVKWAKEKGYRQNQDKAAKIYSLAKEGIPTIPADQTAKMLTHQAVEVLRRVDETLGTILARMTELSKMLPEYSVVRSMGGVGEVLAPRLIADIGDVRRFHSGKALVAYAGVDAPPYQSGKFEGTNRKISKRGSSAIRKTACEVIRSLKSHKEPEDNAVYQFVIKKEIEGKPKKVAKMAGVNKFLKIYYARVTEVYTG